jgi:hypothetical protein
MTKKKYADISKVVTTSLRRTSKSARKCFVMQRSSRARDDLLSLAQVAVAKHETAVDRSRTGALGRALWSKAGQCARDDPLTAPRHASFTKSVHALAHRKQPAAGRPKIRSRVLLNTNCEPPQKAPQGR